MASPLEAQLILCDAAQADPHTGKINMLGAGWSVIKAPAPHAVAIMIKVPWDRTNTKIQVTLQLLDSDGHPLLLTAPDGSQKPVRMDSEIEVGRPAGVAHGSYLPVALALNVPALPLSDGRYVWELDAGGKRISESFQVLKGE